MTRHQIEEVPRDGRWMTTADLERYCIEMRRAGCDGTSPAKAATSLSGRIRSVNGVALDHGEGRYDDWDEVVLGRHAGGYPLEDGFLEEILPATEQAHAEIRPTPDRDTPEPGKDPGREACGTHEDGTPCYHGFQSNSLGAPAAAGIGWVTCQGGAQMTNRKTLIDAARETREMERSRAAVSGGPPGTMP